MTIYAMSTNYTLVWFNSETDNVIGKLVVATFRDENGNLRTSKFIIREIVDIEQ